ncbi:MAG: hypothetical protein QMD36_00015 [Candidatus Aenigmarchaeota archaeon]|nr:hypothetical protein [Candidatus Aenigmarchaeota archaeon]
MRIKGQTAMEYLMTYGWAILIIIVVVAALYAMGIFSIKGGVACSPCFSYFAFVDYSKTTSGTCATPGCLYIRNGPKTINAITATDNGIGVAITCAATPCSAGKDLTIEGIGTTGDRVIEITYTDVSSGLVHTDSGTIHN